MKTPSTKKSRGPWDPREWSPILQLIGVLIGAARLVLELAKR